MLRKSIFLIVLALCFSTQTFVTGRPSQIETDSTVKPSEKVRLEGLPNLGRVTENLYRGGQPRDEGFAALKNLGIQVVVSFREHPGQIDQERRQVEGLGMRFVSIPWKGTDTPKDAQVAQFLDLLRANPHQKVFAHCRRGAERTGVMVAGYRVAFQGWTAAQALDEMERFKFRGFWFRHLKNYVRRFPEAFQNGPAFQRLRSCSRTLPEAIPRIGKHEAIGVEASPDASPLLFQLCLGIVL